MRNFWPKRPSAKGFSIERLAANYREKLSKVSSGSREKEFPILKSSSFVELEREEILNPHFFLSSMHWANRDFSEYRDVA